MYFCFTRNARSLQVDAKAARRVVYQWFLHELHQAHLVHLDVSFNSFVDIDGESLSRLTSLTSLSLYGNGIERITPLPALPSLVHLSIGETAGAHWECRLHRCHYEI